jgi:hypothetical protein
MKKLLASACLVAWVGGCHPTATPSATPASTPTQAPVAAGSSASPAEAYFPLQHGYIYRYQVIDTGASLSKAIVRSMRRSKTEGSLLVPGGRNAFRYTADGVLQQPQGSKAHYVLKAPFRVGAHWLGKRRSRIEIEATALAVRVPAGSYVDCIRTKETRGGDHPILIRTVFCRNVGMVSIEATAGGRQEQMRLESYDAPVNLGPDGVKVQRSGSPKPQQ